MPASGEHPDNATAGPDDAGLDELAADVSRPAHDQLCQEVRLARTKGVGNLADAITELPGLLGVARVISTDTDEAGKIEDALSKAVQRLGGSGTPAIEAVFGMTPDTRGLTVTDRRKRAAALYDHKAYEFFRTRVEPPLLMFVATYLRVLVDEHHLTERERAMSLTESVIGSGLLDKVSDRWTEDFALVPANKPASSHLPPIYHLALGRRGRRQVSEAYSVRRLTVSAEVCDSPTHSRLKRLLKIPNRRYYLVSRGSRGIELEGFYRHPSWFTRVRRAFITMRW